MDIKNTKSLLNNNDGRAVLWLQLSAGTGPKECGWVVAKLSEFIVRTAKDFGLSAERVESLAFDKVLRKQTLIEPDAFLSVLIRLQGDGVCAFAKAWEGTIKWQGESPYRPKHKRVNWFVGVATTVVSEQSVIGLDTLLKEVDVESMRSKGPGGQHVNKTNSAIRVTHRPTQIQVRVESDRSQHRNKKIAIERLQMLLTGRGKSQAEGLERDRWLQHYEVKRGSPVRVFSGLHFTEA